MEILENVLSIEKTKHLQELGVNTGNASMTWMLYPYEEGKQPQLSLREWRTFKEPFRKEHCIPAFTLLDILGLLPKEIKTGTDTYWITMYFSDNCWHICVYNCACGYGYEISKADNGTHITSSVYEGPNDGGKWDVYEDALEAVLQEALKLI